MARTVSVGILVPCLLISVEITTQDFPPAKAAESPTIAEPQHVAVNSSFDADSIGNRSVYMDGTFAPFSGIYESGVRFRVMGDASWYRFITSEDPRAFGTGHYLDGGLLAGYGIWQPRFSVTGLVGPVFGQIVNQSVTTDRVGARAAIEIYARPTDSTMVSGSLSYSTITNYLQVQAKVGLKIFGNVYVGPDTKFAWQQILPWQINFSTSSFATPVSPQTGVAYMHLGAHVSALTLGPALIGVSGGWAHDRQLGNGYYGSVSLYLPF